MTPPAEKASICVPAVLAATLLALSAGVFSAPGRAAAVDQGEGMLTKNCARCHAIGTTGESALDKAPPFRQIVTRYPLENLAESMAEGLTTGHADMPEFEFTPDEIDAILAYLEKLKGDTAGGEKPSDENKQKSP